MIETILNGLLPVAFVILLGWFAGRIGLLKHADADVLATLVIRFALPFALFLAAATTPANKIIDPGLAACLTFGLMGSYLLALALGFYVFKHDLRTATMQALVCGFPDMAYFGAPILVAMYGPPGYLVVLVGNLVTSIIMLPVTIALTHVMDQQEAGHSGASVMRVIGRSLGGAAINPIVFLPVFGVILSFYQVKLPVPVLTAVDLMAKAAGGTSLFALGLMLYGEKLQINLNVLTNIGIKNFIMPAMMLLGVILFRLTGAPAHQAIITGAVPTATAAAMFALKNNTYTADATSTILLSTVLGIGTEALLIGMFAV
ncbi:AEC family transporter [Paraburkholderia sp. DHOC27]|uniref:AEC family transporter n=1 Tax=Paraburkholderia sp. DHOC27 TaxID=2303330 RepID=UPI000E3BFE06|nr:AEC family transporter [Paraburkholderia sp. DHOC27]RFU45245.1 AEC family transporter [Paraburkholderia sp. DHOC27]